MAEVTTSGTAQDIYDFAMVEADGPDCDEDDPEPDDGPNSSDTDDAWANIRIPGLDIEKYVKIVYDGFDSDWKKFVETANVVFPVHVFHKIEARVPPTIPPIDGLDIEGATLEDAFIEGLCDDLPIPVDITCTPDCPPLDFDVNHGEPWKIILECDYWVDDLTEFETLAAADAMPETKDWVDNECIGSFTEANLKGVGTTNDLCGEQLVEEESDSHYTLTEQKEIPALSTYGAIAMVLAMGALILLRIRRP